jgi:biopolymer transport protein ExbD
MLLNREEIVGGLDGLRDRMAELMKGRREKVVFFQADNEVSYDYVVKAMDEMRGGGVEKIGLVTDENLDATGTGPGQ